mgnify:CR=1 FL=1
MPVRKSDIFFLFIAASTVLLFLLLTDAALTRKSSVESRDNVQLVRDYGLTDLCLFTEANYTRHVSQADLHTAFQDSPMAFEHFPSGALVMPPYTLRKLNEKTH